MSGAPQFRIDSAGVVYANEYRSLAGNPIPNGDITAVAAGTGLNGGGTIGDASVALDTTFTDARYAAAVHGHDVSQITNAATLGANAFVGNRTINGSLSATGAMTAPSANFSGTTGTDGSGIPIPLVRIVQTAAATACSWKTPRTALAMRFGRARSIFQFASPPRREAASGIRADATSPVGQTNGLLGVAFSTGGFGVRGDAVAASGGNKGRALDKASAWAVSALKVSRLRRAARRQASVASRTARPAPVDGSRMAAVAI